MDISVLMDAKGWAIMAFEYEIRLVPDSTIQEDGPSACYSSTKIKGYDYDLVLRYKPDPFVIELVNFLQHQGPGFVLTACYHLQRLRAILEDDDALFEAHLGPQKTLGVDRALSLGVDVHQWLSNMNSLTKQLARYGIPRELSVKAFDVAAGVEAACDNLCQRLLDQIDQRHLLEEEGKASLVRSHDTIPDSLISEAALRMLEALSESLEPPTQSLINLLRVQLDRAGVPAFAPKSGEERKDLAVLLTASDPSLSARSIGKAVGVAHTTIRAWQKDPEFKDRVRNSPTIKNVNSLLKKLAN